MKYRLLIPGLFLLLAAFFLAFFVQGAGGHSDNPFDFFAVLLFPACIIPGLLDSWLGGPALLWMSFCFFLSLFQYFMLGYVIDRLMARRARRRLMPR